jgi:hypothetical protein
VDNRSAVQPHLAVVLHSQQRVPSTSHVCVKLGLLVSVSHGCTQVQEGANGAGREHQAMGAKLGQAYGNRRGNVVASSLASMCACAVADSG